MKKSRISAILLAALLLASCSGNNTKDPVNTSGEAVHTTAPAKNDATNAPDATEAPATEAPEVTTEAAETTEAAATEAETEDESINAEPEYSKSENGYTIAKIKGVYYVDGIMIVNKSYPLPRSYDAGGLTGEAYTMFIQMKADAERAGALFDAVVTVRSYKDQADIYADEVDSVGADAADTYCPRPGHSEHQSGLAVDVYAEDPAFASSTAYEWLKDHCVEYGFIIRYPEGKEAITGYSFAPWHLRFVGEDVSTDMFEKGQCFEEYFGITSEYAE